MFVEDFWEVKYTEIWIEVVLSILETLPFSGEDLSLSSCQFEREKIILHEKNLKHKEIILLINFVFAQTYFLIASSQIFKNDAILINHGSFFLEKDSLQHDRFLFLKLNY